MECRSAQQHIALHCLIASCGTLAKQPVAGGDNVVATPQLQDNVPAFESAQAISIVERNLGAPISQSFDSFDPIPIAAASLGQVPSCAALPPAALCLAVPGSVLTQ